MPIATSLKVIDDMEHLYTTLEKATEEDLNELLEVLNSRYGRQAVDHMHPTDGPNVRRRFSAIRGMIIGYINAQNSER